MNRIEFDASIRSLSRRARIDHERVWWTDEGQVWPGMICVLVQGADAALCRWMQREIQDRLPMGLAVDVRAM